MKTLKLAPNLSLPLEVVTQTIAILAKRRAGKSYTMRRLVEQLFQAGQQVVIIDPKGDQWGVRSSADGKGPGLPIIILGGERGDVKRLEPSSGEVIAKLVVQERVSVLIDLSEFRKGEVARFMGGPMPPRPGEEGFLEALYRLKARDEYRTPMMLVIDEADAIAPQKPQAGEERMLGAAEDIVRRGGQRGIGCMFVTQRSAVLNKNILTQAQILVALRTIAPQDLAAMNAWIDVHGTTEQRKTLMESLPSLPIGDAWFWSPGWPTTDGIFKRVHVSPIETFDSGKSPEPGAKPVQPKKPADVDLQALERQMAATIEKAKQDDPKELRKQLAEAKAEKAKLERQLATVVTPLGPAKEGKPLLTDADRELLAKLHAAMVDRAAKAGEVLKAAESRLDKLVQTAAAEYLNTTRNVTMDAGAELAQALERVGFTRIVEKLERVSVAPRSLPITPTPRPVSRPELSAPRAGRVERARPAASMNGSGNDSLGKCERAILTVLANQPDGCYVERLTLLSGYRYSGGFRNSLGALRQLDLIAGQNSGLITITAPGRVTIGEVDPLPTGDALGEYWLQHASFGKCEQAILGALLQHPKGLTAEQLCATTHYEYSGGFRNALGALRTAGVLVGKNSDIMLASSELFD